MVGLAIGGRASLLLWVLMKMNRSLFSVKSEMWGFDIGEFSDGVLL